MASLQRRSPLLESEMNTGTDLKIRELESVGKLRVQALRARDSYVALADPQRLPHAPNTSAGDRPVSMWMSPGDWLVYSTMDEAEALNEWVTVVHSEVPLVATDVSSALVVIELSGARAVDILARDCTLDLEGGAMAPGACARTLFAQTSVLIHRPRGLGTWLLFVERPVARHVWSWLADSVQFAPAVAQ